MSSIFTINKSRACKSNFFSPFLKYIRKEVIQPHIHVRLPCYDFTPIDNHTLGACLPPKRISPTTSGTTDFRGVTGGVYKARERIHRSLADLSLLAIPTSCRRISACNPNWDRLSGISMLLRVSCPLYRPL